MAAKWLKIVVPLGVVAAGASGVFLSSSERNCNDLVDMGNGIVEVMNNVSSPTDAAAAAPQMTSTAADMRAAANDFGSPFDQDARDAADALESLAGAIGREDGDGVSSAIDTFNRIADRTNRDCESARN